MVSMVVLACACMCVPVCVCACVRACVAAMHSLAGPSPQEREGRCEHLRQRLEESERQTCQLATKVHTSFQSVCNRRLGYCRVHELTTPLPSIPAIHTLH